jgi:hypothetical protein
LDTSLAARNSIQSGLQHGDSLCRPRPRHDSMYSHVSCPCPAYVIRCGYSLWSCTARQAPQRPPLSPPSISLEPPEPPHPPLPVRRYVEDAGVAAAHELRGTAACSRCELTRSGSGRCPTSVVHSEQGSSGEPRHGQRPVRVSTCRRPRCPRPAKYAPQATTRMPVIAGLDGCRTVRGLPRPVSEAGKIRAIADGLRSRRRRLGQTSGRYRRRPCGTSEPPSRVPRAGGLGCSRRRAPRESAAVQGHGATPRRARRCRPDPRSTPNGFHAVTIPNSGHSRQSLEAEHCDSVERPGWTRISVHMSSWVGAVPVTSDRAIGSGDGTARRVRSVVDNTRNRPAFPTASHSAPTTNEPKNQPARDCLVMSRIERQLYHQSSITLPGPHRCGPTRSQRPQRH